MEKPIYSYNNEKNVKLLAERGVGFEDIITILDTKGYLAVIDNPNTVNILIKKSIWLILIVTFIWCRLKNLENNVCLRLFTQAAK